MSAAASEPAAPRAQPPAEVKRPTAAEFPVQLSKPRFVQRRLGRPSSGPGTPLLWCRTSKVELAQATRAFAFEPGAPRFSVWPAPACAWLVRDLDGDGAVTSGRELFGSFTATEGGLAPDGFSALSALDENRDGVVDGRDPAHATLQLWFDRDADRRVGPGELEPLGARTLLLAHEVVAQCDAAGNCVRERAQLTDGWMLDLHLMLLTQPPLPGAMVAAGERAKATGLSR